MLNYTPLHCNVELYTILLSQITNQVTALTKTFTIQAEETFSRQTDNCMLSFSLLGSCCFIIEL